MGQGVVEGGWEGGGGLRGKLLQHKAPDWQPDWQPELASAEVRLGKRGMEQDTRLSSNTCSQRWYMQR